MTAIGGYQASPAFSGYQANMAYGATNYNQFAASQNTNLSARNACDGGMSIVAILGAFSLIGMIFTGYKGIKLFGNVKNIGFKQFGKACLENGIKRPYRGLKELLWKMPKAAIDGAKGEAEGGKFAYKKMFTDYGKAAKQYIVDKYHVIADGIKKLCGKGTKQVDTIADTFEIEAARPDHHARLANIDLDGWS